uniref:Putative methyltransferase n=1 Tax=viral metagenome TaxID=1070528 RepID=A0A6M3IT62_9ZZZZ
MTTSTKVAIRNAMRLDLSDPGASGELFTNDKLDRAFDRALSDYSRFLPRHMIYETTLEEFTVTDEAFTAGAAALTWVSLANKPIKWASEAVVDAASAAMTRGTDYYMDYANGKITHKSGGSIANDEACTISYELDPLVINISNLTTFIRLDSVEYPVGSVPQKILSSMLWGDLLWLTSGDSDQTRMAESRHARVYYLGQHVVPAENDTDGTYPGFIENSIILAANAYALFEKALAVEHQSVTDLATIRTLLGTTISHTALDTALTNAKKYLDNNTTADAAGLLADITTDVAGLRTAILASYTAMIKYLENNTNEDAAGKLAQITTDIAALRTAIDTAYDNVKKYLDNNATEDAAGLLGDITLKIIKLRDAVETAVEAANTALDVVVADTTGDLAKAAAIDATGFINVDVTPSAKNILKAGQLLLNTNNIGQNVAENHSDMARAAVAAGEAQSQERRDLIAVANARINSALGYFQEANTRLAALQSYIDHAGQFVNIAQTFVAEANGRTNVIGTYINESGQYVNIANSFANEAASRIDLLRTYIQQSQQYIEIVNGFLGEAQARLGDIDRYLAEAEQYSTEIMLSLELSDRYRSQAIEYRTEAWSIWRDKAQYIGEYSTSSRLQMAQSV